MFPRDNVESLFKISFINAQKQLIIDLGKKIRPALAENKENTDHLLVSPELVNPILNLMSRLKVTTSKPYTISSADPKDSYEKLIRRINRVISMLNQGYSWPKQHELAPILSAIKKNIVQSIEIYPGLLDVNNKPIQKDYLASSSKIANQLREAVSLSDSSCRQESRKNTGQAYCIFSSIMGMGAFFGVISGIVHVSVIGGQMCDLAYCNWYKNSSSIYNCTMGTTEPCGNFVEVPMSAKCDVSYCCPPTSNITIIHDDAHEVAQEVCDHTRYVYEDSSAAWSTAGKDVGYGVIAGTGLGALVCGLLFGKPSRCSSAKPAENKSIEMEVSRHESDIEVGVPYRPLTEPELGAKSSAPSAEISFTKPTKGFSASLG